MYRGGGAKMSRHGLGGELVRVVHGRARARGDAPSARLAAARAWENGMDASHP